MDKKFRTKGTAHLFRKPNQEEREILTNGEIPKEMIRVFPRIINPKKSYKGPRKYAIISYMMIPDDKRPQKDIEGLFIVRAERYNTVEEAQAAAEKMVRERDSLNVYQIVQEEESYILSNSSKYSMRDYKINVERTGGEAAGMMEGLDENAQRMMDAQMNDMMEAKDVVENTLKQDEEQKEREQFERITQMRLQAERTDTEGTLEYYTRMRSSLNNMLINIKKIAERLPLMEKLKQKAHELIAKIKRYDAEYPHYQKQWKAEEEKALYEAGMKNVNINTQLVTPEEYCDGDYVSVRNEPSSDVAGTSSDVAGSS